MGTLMGGFVEIKLFDIGIDDWFQVIVTDPIVSGGYDLMGCLFDVRNYANFVPLFAGRGIPDDCSEETVEYLLRLEDPYHSETWCSYAELMAVSVGESAALPDQRVWLDYEGQRIKAMPQTDEERGRAVTMTRGEALDNGGYRLLLEMMALLVQRFGADCVRWVVYFVD